MRILNSGGSGIGPWRSLHRCWLPTELGTTDEVFASHHPVFFFFFFLCLSSTYQPIAYQLGDKETEVLCLAKGKMHNIWGPFLVPCIIKRNGVVRHDLPLLNPCWLLAAFPGTVMRLMGLYLLSWPGPTFLKMPFCCQHNLRECLCWPSAELWLSWSSAACS